MRTIQTLNGVLDLETRELTPTTLSSPSAGAEWNPNATAPRWDEMVNRVFESPFGLQHAIRQGLRGQWGGNLVLVSDKWEAWRPLLTGLSAALGAYFIQLDNAPTAGGLSDSDFRVMTRPNARIVVTAPVELNTRLTAAQRSKLTDNAVEYRQPWSRESVVWKLKTGLTLIPSRRIIRDLPYQVLRSTDYEPTASELAGILRWCVQPKADVDVARRFLAALSNDSTQTDHYPV